MSALTDPIAALRRAQEQSCHCGCLDGGPSTESMGGGAALEELERRARIEARRDDFGASYVHKRDVSPRPGDPVAPHYVYLFTDGGHSGVGPDYHSALEAALNAAGAP